MAASAQTRVINSLQQIISQGKKESAEEKAYVKLIDELAPKTYQWQTYKVCGYQSLCRAHVKLTLMPVAY
jgi:hypothetical protein